MALKKDETLSNENWEVFKTDENDPEELKDYILSKVGQPDANVMLDGPPEAIVDVIERMDEAELDDGVIDGIIDGDDETETGITQLPDEILPSYRGQPLKNPSLIIEIDDTKKYLCADGVTREEPMRSKLAFQTYLTMGRDRSLKKLAARIVKDKPDGWENSYSEISVERKLSEYSANFDWQNRIRMYVIEQSGRAVANAQNKAAKSKHERIRRSQKLQQIAEKILDVAVPLASSMDDLTPEEAKQLIKPAVQMMQVGLAAERAEIGESIAKLVPPKPIEAMSEEELDAWIGVLRSELI